jgi:transposase
MRKISPAEARQTRNVREQKLTMGLGLGDRSSWYCVSDEAGEVLLEQRLSTTPRVPKGVFGGMPRSGSASCLKLASPISRR